MILFTHSAIFSRRTFDICIIDEASQITLPTCVGPIRFADRFVLVGDHHQLPPLVRSRDARKRGLDVSLFRRLCEAHPEAVVDLNQQYRMNKDIMLLANELVYRNKLVCGTEDVARQELELPLPDGVRTKLHDGENSNDCDNVCWLEDVVAPRYCWLLRNSRRQSLTHFLSRKVVFIDTDVLPAPESRAGDLIQNETEASLVHQVPIPNKHVYHETDTDLPTHLDFGSPSRLWDRRKPNRSNLIV